MDYGKWNGWIQLASIFRNIILEERAFVRRRIKRILPDRGKIHGCPCWFMLYNLQGKKEIAATTHNSDGMPLMR